MGISRCAAVLIAALAGCDNQPQAAPDAGTSSAPRGECVFFELDDGRQVCLMSEPQGPLIEEAVSETGLSTAPLAEPESSGPVPMQVDLRNNLLAGCLQVRDQTDCGWCTVHALGGMLDAFYCAEGCPSPRVSMAHLYWNGHDNSLSDCGFGWAVTDAVSALMTTPLVPESVWPYTGSARGMTARRPSDAELRAQGRYRAMGSRIIRGGDLWGGGDNMIRSLQRALASGRTVVAWSGLCFNHGWKSGTGIIPAPTRPCGRNGGAYDGYHAYLLVGYDEAERTFLMLNSWGDSWGRNGYARLSYDFVRAEVTGGLYLDQVDRSLGACPNPTAETPAARCEAITSCGECTASTNCIQCDDRCVLANEFGNGPMTGTCSRVAATPTECPFNDDPCLAAQDCGSCASQPNCAWCAARTVCLPWPSGAATCVGGRVATAANQCNDTIRNCEGTSSCDDCVALEGCGWCGALGKCGGGGPLSSDRLGCGSDWTGHGALCPGSVVDAGPSCGPADGPCATDDQCCEGLQCVANACRDPASCQVENTSCTTGSQCCGGLSCLPSRFEGPLFCCAGFAGANCETADDCCGEMTCTSGQCQDQLLNESCASDSDCENSAHCPSGTCVPKP
jgi:hypothetical protein